MPAKRRSMTAAANKSAPATKAAAPKRGAAKKAKAPAAKKPPAKKKQQVEDNEESEEEVAPAKKAAPKKTIPIKPANRAAAKPAAEKEAPAPKKTAAKKAPAKKAPAKKAVEQEEDDSDDQEEEVTPAPAKRSVGKKTAAAPKVPEKPNTSRKRTARQDEAKQDATRPAKRGKKAPAPAKRARVDDSDDDAEEEPAPKKAKPAKPAPKARAPRAKKPAPPRKIINKAPTQTLDVFVFGEGGAGELGLGHRHVDGKKPLGVRRPRLNPNLKKCVEVYTGSMHGIALTQDNKVLTWGVNDGDALGRDTFGEINSDPNDAEDSGLNPFESVPTEIDMTNIEPGTVFTQVVASDSASFALTDDGKVYGWGEFLNAVGAASFMPGVVKTKPKPDSDEKRVHMAPVPLPWLKKVTQIAAGYNHVLALEGKTVKAWGNGESFELARRLVQRNAENALIPASVGLPRDVKPVKLVCGGFHNFVIDDKDRVWGWGLNNYNQLGLDLTAEECVESPSIMKPTLITLLAPYKIVDMAAGQHFTVACTDDGRLLTWGRCDSRQCGLPDEMLTEENGVVWVSNKPKTLIRPTVVPAVKNIVRVSAGPEHAMAIARDGKAWSWGFSENYQTGQGETDAIEEPEPIDNTAVRNVKLTWAGCGAQWSAVAAPVKPPAPAMPSFLFGPPAGAASA